MIPVNFIQSECVSESVSTGPKGGQKSQFQSKTEMEITTEYY